MSNPCLIDVYLVYAGAALVVLISCLFVRIVFGASPIYLARTRCYELPPLRLIFHAVHAGTWLAFIVAVVITVRYGWAYYESPGDEYRTTALWSAGTGLLAGLLGLALYKILIRLRDNRPPNVAVRGVKTSEGISPLRLANLGREQFPEMLAYGHTAGLWARGILMMAGFACLGIVITAATDWGRQKGLDAAGIEAIRQVRALLPPVPHHWAIFVGTSAGLGLALLLFTNKTYTLIRFPTTLLLVYLLASLGWSCAAILDVPDEKLGTVVGGLGLACAVRWASDLSRAARFKRTRDVSQPVARRLAELVPYLATLKSRPDCQLAKLDEAELRQRITRGCRNVEDASFLVTRNLGRFLSLVRIEYEHFAAVMLRYLTVRRFVTTSSGGGTSRFLQHPVVPVWDEVLFPLHPPKGYRNWLDPLFLGSEWDIVSICSPCGGTGRTSCSGCGGSGHQTKTETYTEYSGGQSVTRTRTYEVSCTGCGGSGRVTCSSCSGHGRVVYQQTLNTHWQRLMPTHTAPHVHIPEFMEDAEERTYYRVPLIEDRESLALRPLHDGIGQDLWGQLSRVVPAMSAELPDFTRAVEQLHAGTIYRADFQVTGFWVIRIGFRRLPGKVGWFFGRRPEFHFPALPLSWGMVGTVLFVLPFLLMSLLLIVETARARLETSLPPIASPPASGPAAPEGE